MHWETACKNAVIGWTYLSFNKFPIYICNVLCFLFTASSSCAIFLATQWHWNVVIVSGYPAKYDSGVTARAGRVADCQTFFWKIDADFSQSVQVNLLTGIKHESAQQLHLSETIRSRGKLHRISTLQTKPVFTVWNPFHLWNNVFGLLSLSFCPSCEITCLDCALSLIFFLWFNNYVADWAKSTN